MIGKIDHSKDDIVNDFGINVVSSRLCDVGARVLPSPMVILIILTV